MASKLLTIKDESATGKIINTLELSIQNEIVTVREIIKHRVFAEVEKYNQQASEYFHGLIQPSGAEQTLNGYKMQNRKFIDAEKQYLTALDAFQKNGFFVLIDNQQVEKLDEEVLLQENTVVSFIKLVPLVGG